MGIGVFSLRKTLSFKLPSAWIKTAKYTYLGRRLENVKCGIWTMS
jgi:hypothetical protein